MPSRSLRTIRSGPLLDEVSARLPLFENLPPDTIQQLSTAGYGRGFLTASLRARLRKAGYRDLGQLAQTSPDAIARVRKFGPIRVESVRTFILNEIARRLPGARDGHTAGASAERRLGLLRAMPVERVCFDAGILAGLGLVGRSCADLASRSRSELLDTGLVTSGEVDRLVTTLARLLGEGQTPPPSAIQAPEETPTTETETLAARRAALLATQDREWEEAAPARD